MDDDAAGSRLFDGLGAAALRARLLAGELSVAEIAAALIDAIGADPLHAWAAVDPEQLMRDAARLDRTAPQRRRELTLFGVPVGIKDCFDTAELPTAYGSPIYAGHRPSRDAAAVTALKRAGALIAGKTALAEFAWLTPPATENPRFPGRTPGGSSSGSAAAVAAGTVPLATGTQTAGSINRPAAYCGIAGFKPSFGRYDRGGVKLMAPTLDTVGMLARSVTDLRLADRALSGRPAQAARGSTAPRLAAAPTEFAEVIEPDGRAAFDALAASLRAQPIVLPGYAGLAMAQEAIQLYESRRSLAPELARAPERLSDGLREKLGQAAALDETIYATALSTLRDGRPALIAAIAGYDAVLTPGTTGPPPPGLRFTGDPLFSRVWTAIGAPSLSLPLAWSDDGLPAGVQLVAAPGRDGELLAAGAWLTELSGRCG